MKKILIATILSLIISIIPSMPLHPEDDAAALYRKGMEHYEKKNYKSAHDLFRKALLMNPFNEEASNMYWNMKALQQHEGQAGADRGLLRDTEKETPRGNSGGEGAGVRKVKTKETRRRGDRADRESAATLLDLRGEIAELNKSIDTGKKELALLEQRRAEKLESERENSRAMIIVSAAILSLLVAASAGMLIYAIIIISRREKGESVALMPGDASTGEYVNGRKQHDRFQQMPYPLPGRREALSTASRGMTIRQKNEIVATASSEYFSRMEITIAGFVRLIEHRLNRDNNDFRVRKLCHDIGKRLGLTSVEMTELRTAALMKDVGFLLIPESLLLKQGALTSQEREVVEKHVSHSLKIAQYTPQPPRILEAIEKHHERMDGSGYPYGISGTGIPLFSRVIGVCDTFIALTSDRPYRAALDNDTALAVMEREARLFDQEIVAILRELFGQEVVRTQKPGDYLFDRDLYPEETLSRRA